MSTPRGTFPDTAAPEISDETDYIRLRREVPHMSGGFRTQWSSESWDAPRRAPRRGETWDECAQTILDEARWRDLDYEIIEYERRDK